MTPERAAIVIALAGAFISIVAVLYLARQVKHARVANQFQVLREVRDLLAQRPAHTREKPSAYYGLRHRFKKPDRPLASNPNPGRSGYEDGMLERLRIVKYDLDDDEREADLVLVRALVNSYNMVADLVDNRFIATKPILTTYHLAIIRELFIAEPYVLYVNIEDKERTRWGLRPLLLAEIARAYHAMNPIHRQREVYFLGDRDYGPVFSIEPPDRTHRLWWWVRVKAIGYPTIDERAKRRQKKELEALAKRIEQEAPHDSAG